MIGIGLAVVRSHRTDSHEETLAATNGERGAEGHAGEVVVLGMITSVTYADDGLDLAFVRSRRTSRVAIGAPERRAV